MRVHKVVTNETCDLACRFCAARRSHERASVAGEAAVRRSLAEAAAATTLVLSGGEPTRRSDLPQLVAHARAVAPDAELILETSGTRLDDALATALAGAGLDAVRMHVPGGPETIDAITGGREVWRDLTRGVAAVARAQLALEVSIPIVADNVHAPAAGLAALAHSGHSVRRAIVRPVLESPDPAALASVPDLVAGVARVADQSRPLGIPVSLDPETFVPPCALSRPDRVAHLYSLNPGAARRPGYARTAACEGCRVADRCPGVPDSAPAFDGFVPRPIERDRLRRRLTVIETPQAQAERELVTHERYRRPDGSVAPAHVIRIAFACNQACGFCFVSTHLPAVSRPRIEAAIDEAAQSGAILVLSGGEPTLDPALCDYVRRGKSRGVPEVELQTNATRLADDDLATRLADAGVDIAFVSLHGATTKVAERVTDAPGTLAATLTGLDALARTSIRIRINFVLCRSNFHEFPAFADLVATRWPAAAITVSFVGMSTDLVPRTPDLVPRYADVLPALREGVHRAEAAGVEVDGFDSMCGIPLCLAPGSPQDHLAKAEIPAGEDRGEFLHPPPCTRCVLQTRCFGLRRGYAELYGWQELVPVAR